MTNSKNVKVKNNSEISSNERVVVSLVYRDVPKDKRIKLEKLAREFTKKHRKLVNYIEK